MRTQNYAPISERSESWFCSSNLLFSKLSFAEQYFFTVAICQGLLQYMCFPTLSRVRTGNTPSQCLCNLSLPIGFPTDSQVAQWLYLSLSTLKELHLYEVYFKNSSSCPARTYTKTLNWVNSDLLQCCQTLAPVSRLEEKSRHWMTLHNFL